MEDDSSNPNPADSSNFNSNSNPTTNHSTPKDDHGSKDPLDMDPTNNGSEDPFNVEDPLDMDPTDNGVDLPEEKGFDGVDPTANSNMSDDTANSNIFNHINHTFDDMFNKMADVADQLFGMHCDPFGAMDDYTYNPFSQSTSQSTH